MPDREMVEASTPSPLMDAPPRCGITNLER
jgi:hypothetical protein